MPEVIVRKRLGKRSGSLRYRVRRWVSNNRSTAAACAAFVIVFVIALGAVRVLMMGDWASAEVGATAERVDQ